MMPDADPEPAPAPSVYAAVVREGGRPRDANAATPIVWVFLIVVLAMWGGWYLGDNAGAFDSARMDGDPAPTGAPPAPPPPLDPVARGKKIFANTCASCHQATGLGVPDTYPPLAGSEWVVGDEETVIRVLLLGVNGPIEVRGAAFNSVMPAWSNVLDDDRLAAVATYIRSAWGNQATAITPDQVATVRASLGARSAAWTAAELTSLRASPPEGR
jgi:mono/diheme cytochrome c family protein